MTTNERLYAAGLLGAFDDAVRHRDRASMLSILAAVEFVEQDAASLADGILAHRTLYGRAIPWSFEEAKAYGARVRVTLQLMLSAETRFPCALGVAKEVWHWDGPLIFYLEPVNPYGGTFEGRSIIEELDRRLNETFANERPYCRIHVTAPHRFLGRASLTEQDRDNETSRRIRLRDGAANETDHA